ncbi:hypothetical protein LP417_07230 [Polaromonas sp. P1-6]|nr:hypothetical protein LP417_07230 [Polaromonas sp. P1-6]
MSDRNLNRFSQIYVFGGEALQDSDRFRVRLASHFSHCFPSRSSLPDLIEKEIERECGVRVSSFGMYSSVTTLIEKGKIRDVLDSISVAFRVASASGYPSAAKEWQAQIPRFFAEENLAYRIDAACVVHRFVDEEFYRSTTSAIRSLGSAKLSAAQEALQRGLSYLTGLDQNTKGAVTATFEACEIVAKHLVPEAQNLHAKLCKTQLLALCMAPNAGAAEQKVETGVFAAMAEWVNAVHNYRHGQAEEQPVAPSLELAVQLVSMGCSFIRRLAQALEASAFGGARRCADKASSSAAARKSL